MKVNLKKIISFLTIIGLLNVSVGDYVTGDIKNGASAAKKAKKIAKSSIVTSSIGTQTVVLISVFFASFVFLVFTLLMSGFSFWFILTFIIWVLFIINIKKMISIGTFSIVNVLIGFSIIFTISLFISIISIFSGDVVSNIDGNGSHVENFASSSSNSDKCFAAKLKEKGNDRITVGVTYNDDVFSFNTKSNYSITELDGLSFGFDVEETIDGDYILAEVCDGDKSLSGFDLEDAMLYQADSEEYGSTVGNYTQFSNMQDDGSLYRYIDSPGTYQVYIYSSSNAKKWYIADKLEISVR